jgi:hypothetical protein
MNKTAIKKFLDHPDKDMIIAKLIQGSTPEDVHVWLESKYTTPSESRFVISLEFLKTFANTHLDFYVQMREDILKVKSPDNDIDKALSATVRGNKKYKERLAELVGSELSTRDKVNNCLAMIEMRVEQVFDKIQDDPAEFQDDHTLFKYLTLLMDSLDKANKINNGAPDQVIQHNHTLQVADKQIGLIIETVKDVLSMIDYEASLYFVEQYTKRIGSLDFQANVPVPTEVRLAEAKFLTQTVGDKLK